MPGGIACALPTLEAKRDVAWVVTLRPLQPGTAAMSASAMSEAHDPEAEDNSALLTVRVRSRVYVPLITK